MWHWPDLVWFPDWHGHGEVGRGTWLDQTRPMLCHDPIHTSTLTDVFLYCSAVFIILKAVFRFCGVTQKTSWRGINGKHASAEGAEFGILLILKGNVNMHGRLKNWNFTPHRCMFAPEAETAKSEKGLNKYLGWLEQVVGGEDRRLCQYVPRDEHQIGFHPFSS